jgi:prepilin-type N-terminal cleavage/methylation domain-containing protein
MSQSIGYSRPGRTRRGFTVLELLITLMALLTLALIAVPTFNWSTNRARETSVLRTAESLANQANIQSSRNDSATLYVTTPANVDFAIAAWGQNGQNGFTVTDEGTEYSITLETSGTVSCSKIYLVGEPMTRAIADKVDCSSGLPD